MALEHGLEHVEIPQPVECTDGIDAYADLDAKLDDHGQVGVGQFGASLSLGVSVGRVFQIENDGVGFDLVTVRDQ